MTERSQCLCSIWYLHKPTLSPTVTGNSAKHKIKLSSHDVYLGKHKCTVLVHKRRAKVIWWWSVTSFLHPVNDHISCLIQTKVASLQAWSHSLCWMLDDRGRQCLCSIWCLYEPTVSPTVAGNSAQYKIETVWLLCAKQKVSNVGQ